MSGKATIYDIATALNITAATVSRALNDNPKISEKTKLNVLAMAEKLNYKQNRLALALKSGKSRNVGVIVPRIDRNFFSNIIKGIEDELYPNGFHVIICQSYDQKEREEDNINTLLNAQVDGIFMSVSNAMTDTAMLKRILDKNVPLIFFDRKKDFPGVSSVTIDDFAGGYKATKHLINEGYRNIIHLSGDRSLEIYKNRFEGYKKALIDSGLSFHEDFTIECTSSIESGRVALKTLLKTEFVPDAIFSASDFVALGAIEELKSHGYHVPEDLGVVGFSNEPFTSFKEISISSVDQSPLEMGKITARVFLEQVTDNKNVKIEKKVVLSPELHIRNSSSKRIFVSKSKSSA